MTLSVRRAPTIRNASAAAAGWIALALWAVPVLSGAAEPLVRFSETEAARAFREGRYEEAVAELLRLLETNPDNVLVLRYLALSYDRLGRLNDALRVFIEALALDPDNVALLYHSGETLHNARYVDDARRHFLRVIELAPDSEYARRARIWLAEQARQEAFRQPPGPPPPIALQLAFGWRRDEYRFAESLDSERRETVDRLTETLMLEYFPLRTAQWTLALDVSGQGAQVIRNRDGGSDIWQWGAGARAQRVGEWAGVRLTGLARVYHQRVYLDGGSEYGHTTGAAAQLGAGWSPHALTLATYHFAADDFREEGFDPLFASRDAHDHRVSAEQHLFFWGNRLRLTFGVEYEENDAEGRNFDFDGPAYFAGAGVALPWGVRLDAGYEYREESYRNFAGPVRRETERREWSVALSRWFARHWLVALHYRDADEESSIRALDYQRRAWGASVIYAY